MEWPEPGGVHATALALGVLSAALFLLLVGFWSRRPRGTEAHAAKAESGELHDTLLRLQDELRQFVQDMSGRLDAKMQALRRLLNQAQSTIDELRKLRGNSTRLSAPAPPVSPLDSEVEAEEPAAPTRAEPAGRSHARGPGARPADPAGLDLRNQRYLRVCSLADEGLDPAAIAGESGIQRGEVDLILSLRRKQHRPDRGSRTEPTRIVNSSEEAVA